MKIQARTLFDCSATGVTGSFRIGQIPFEDRAGQTVTDVSSWTRSRNQQRNWETLQQMISLRAQPTITQTPKAKDGAWYFEFEVETPGVYSSNNDLDNLDGLINECENIPMVTDLGEAKSLQPCLITQGPDQNLWFDTINS